jgi:hypothetical protein
MFTVMRTSHVAFLAAAVLAAPLMAQVTSDPFPTPIPATDGVVTVGIAEFASVPDVGGQAARMNLLVDEAGTKRLFVNDMRGQIYTVSYDGKAVAPYIDINAPDWAVPVNSQGSERGFQSFAFHPQFTQRGAPGFGKFYTYTDTSNMTPTPDFLPGGTPRTHDLVLLEWTAKTPAAAAYDGAAPKELMRFAHPFGNHNGGQIAFHPGAAPGSPDYGLLYIGSADGGSGGDPFKAGQNLGLAFGKILRIDPLGSNSANKKYGIPASNPFAGDNDPNTLGEIYAYGVRNPQRLFWDSRGGMLYVAEIGQNTVEEISPVTSGANLGWNIWEASYTFVAGRGGGVDTANPRNDAKVTYPVAEYDHKDPLLQTQSAITGGVVYRQGAIKQLTNLLIFGDNPSGEVFYVPADSLPKTGGQAAIRRVLFKPAGGEAKTLLQLIKEKNTAQGKPPAARADLRFGYGPNGQLFLLNKRDGTIRVLLP